VTLLSSRHVCVFANMIHVHDRCVQLRHVHVALDTLSTRQVQLPPGFKAELAAPNKLDKVVITSQEPRKKPPIELEKGARGGYWELFMNWKPFIAIPVYLVIFPAAQGSRTFSDIWISQWTSGRNTWGPQIPLTEWEFYAVYVGFVIAFFLSQVNWPLISCFAFRMRRNCAVMLVPWCSIIGSLFFAALFFVQSRSQTLLYKCRTALQCTRFNICSL